MIEQKTTTTNGSRGPEASASSTGNVKQADLKHGFSDTEREDPTAPSTPVNLADRKKVDRLIAQLRREYKPIGLIETVLVERIALYTFRLEQARFFEEDLNGLMKAESAFPPSNQFREMLAAAILAKAFPEGKEVTDASVREALSHAPFLREVLSEPPPETHPRSSPFDVHVFRRFQQYDTGLQMGFLNAVRQLDRFQTARTQAQKEKKSPRSRRKS